MVLVGILNEDLLRPLIRDQYADLDAVSLLDSKAPFRGRLQRFFEEIEEEHPLLLVLDDFENNITLNPDSSEGFLLVRVAADTLAALGNAIRGAHSRSRLIVTTRYWSEGSFPKIDLAAEQLPQMDSAELGKKARKERPKMEPAEAQKLISLAAGNPRLFESLSTEERADAQDVFREKLELDVVVETLPEEEKVRLARLSVFHVPRSSSPGKGCSRGRRLSSSCESGSRGTNRASGRREFSTVSGRDPCATAARISA